MAYKYIIYEPGKVARIKLNRPAYKNALSYVLMEELDDAFKRADSDDSVEVIVLSGEGSDFSAGHDLGSPESVAEAKERGWDKDARSSFYADKYHRHDIRFGWRNLAKPTIAMVQGWCVYGAYMTATAMDLIFASEDAKFVPSPTHQFQTLPWDMPICKAKEIVFEHRVVPAREARDLGLVNRIYPRKTLEKETLAYANRVAENLRDRVRGAKLAFNQAQDTMGFTTSAVAAYHMNQIYRGFGFGSEEAQEMGIRGATPRERRLGRPSTALENLKIKEETELK